MNDLISRQAVLDYPIRLDHYDKEHGNRHFVLGIESVMEYVESLPSAGQNCVLCEYYTEIETDDGIKGKCTRRTGSDLISRQDIKYHTQLEAMGNGQYEEVEVAYKNDIESLPSADRPAGEWVRLEREENVYDLHGVPTWGVNYMCDKCGFITTAIQDHFGQYRWCPSCGEKKRGESHEHDKRTSQEVTETGEPVETQ